MRLMRGYGNFGTELSVSAEEKSRQFYDAEQSNWLFMSIISIGTQRTLHAMHCLLLAAEPGAVDRVTSYQATLFLGMVLFPAQLFGADCMGWACRECHRGCETRGRESAA